MNILVIVGFCQKNILTSKTREYKPQGGEKSSILGWRLSAFANELFKFWCVKHSLLGWLAKPLLCPRTAIIFKKLVPIKYLEKNLSYSRCNKNAWWKWSWVISVLQGIKSFIPEVHLKGMCPYCPSLVTINGKGKWWDMSMSLLWEIQHCITGIYDLW